VSWQPVFLGAVAGWLEAVLVQWTSLAARPSFLVFVFVVTTVLFLALATLLVGLRHVLHIWRGTDVKASSSLLPIGLFLAAFYVFTRAQMVGVLGPRPVLVGIIILSTAMIAIPWVSSKVPPSYSGRLLLTAASVAVALALTLEGLWFSPAPYLLAGTLGLTLLILRLVRRVSLRLSSRASGHALTGIVFLVPVSVAVFSYPLAPGRLKPIVQASRAIPTPTVIDSAGPNVILIILDTVRADHLSVYGYAQPTSPVLESLAQQATLYTQAYSTATFSLPSSASMLTGLLPHQHRADFRLARADQAGSDGSALEILPVALDERFTTLPEHLQGLGYDTALVAANFAYFSPFYGLTQGFSYVDSRPPNVLDLEFVAAPWLRRLRLAGTNQLYDSLAAAPYLAPAIVAHTVDWLDDHRQSPFFLLINFMDAHEPWTAARVARSTSAMANSFPVVGPPSRRTDYDLALGYVDHYVGEFFDALRDRALFDDSLIIVTSDHGETFLGDDQSAHAQLPWQSQIHVPLIVKTPGQTAARESSVPIAGTSLPSIVFETLGLDPPAEVQPLLRRASGTVIAEAYFADIRSSESLTSENLQLVRPSAWALIEGGWKLIRFSHGGSQLYHLEVDPQEQTDLAATEPEMLERMDRRLASLLPVEAFQEYLDPTVPQRPDAETLKRLRSLGYIR